MRPRLYRPKYALILFILLLTAGSLSTAQAAEPWIALAAGSTFELLADADQVTLRAPVTLVSGIEAGQVTLRLLDASIGQRHETRLMDAFKLLPLSAPNAERGPAIEIQVDLTQLPGQGTYNLLLEASTPSQPDSQALQIQVVVPAAKLTVPGTVVVENTLWALSRTGVKGAPLVLRETSGKSRLTDISIQQMGFYDSANLPAAGSLTFPDLPQSIYPNGAVAPQYSLNGGFPLGTSKETVEISAPQLEAPVMVDFEVQTRYAAWLILLVILAGLVVGYLGRTGLESQIKLGETRLKGYDLLKQFNLSRQAHSDEDFRTQLDQISTVLQASLAGRNPVTMAAAIQDAHDSLAEALKNLQARRELVQQRLQVFSSITDTSWSLPAGIDAALGPARQAAGALHTLLKDDNLKQAQEQLHDVEKGLKADLPRLVSKWRGELDARFDELSRLDIPLPANVAKNLNGAVGPLQKLLGEMPGIELRPGQGDLSPVLAVLEKIHNLRINTVEMLAALGSWLRSTLNSVINELRKAGVQEEKVLELEKSQSAFIDELSAQDDPDQALRLLDNSRLNDLDRTWKVLLRGEEAQVPAGQKAEFENLVQSRQYYEAAHLLSLIGQRHRLATEGLPLGEMQPATLEEGLPSTSPLLWLTRAAFRPLNFVSFEGTLEEAIPESPDVAQARTWRQIAWAKSGQSLIAGFGILIVGYLLFSPKFVGTFSDFAGIFLWAIGLDVTIDAFLQLAKSSIKS